MQDGTKQKIISALKSATPLLGLLGLAYLLKSEEDKMKVHFLDVGDGHCTHIRFPNGEDMLVDCYLNKDGTNVVEYLKKQNIGSIETLVITHPHIDHFRGITELYNNFDLGEVWHVDYHYVPEEFRSDFEKEEFENYYEILESHGRPVFNGQQFSAGNVPIKVLNPTESYIRSLSNPSHVEINNSSIVLSLQYGADVIIPGDNHSDGWDDILSRWSFSSVDVLLASHHGQKSGFNSTFLKQASPKHVVFSSGSKKPYDAYDNYYYYADKIYTTRSEGDIVFNF